MTELFPVKFGVKQGCKLSPTLYSIYINDLADQINRLNNGINVGNDVNISLIYADDIALLASDEQALQHQLDVVNVWCKRWRVTLNSSKTKILHFRNKSVEISEFQFTCGDLALDYDNKYRYLGLTFNEFMDYKSTVKEITKAARRALSALYTKYLSCGGMSFEVYTKLYSTLVEPVLYYGAGI